MPVKPKFGTGKLLGGTLRSPLAFKPGPVKLVPPPSPSTPAHSSTPPAPPPTHSHSPVPTPPPPPSIRAIPSQLAPKPPQIPESRADEPDERKASRFGWFAGIASALQPPRELPDAPEPARRAALPLPPVHMHAPTPFAPAIAAPEPHAPEPMRYTGRADLPDLAPPQLGRASPVPPSMDIEAY